MKQKYLIIFFLLLGCQMPVMASVPNLDIFFRQQQPSKRYVPRSVDELVCTVQSADYTDEQYREALSYHDEGLKLLKDYKFEQAEKYFAYACSLIPSERIFWNNRMVALQNISGKEVETIKAGQYLLALDKSNAKLACIIGEMWQDHLQNSKIALDYFYYAHSQDKSSPILFAALLQALQKNNYKEDLLELLTQYEDTFATDPNFACQLAQYYKDAGMPNEALSAINRALPNDKGGMLTELLITTRFYAGDLYGLKEEIEKLLNTSEQIQNRETLQKIMFSLDTHTFKLQESFSLLLVRPSAISDLVFLVRPVPSIPGTQHSTLESAEFITPKGRLKAELNKKDKGYAISLPDALRNREIKLQVTYKIKTKPLFVTDLPPILEPKPDISTLSSDPLLSLSYPPLKALARKISQMEGNYVRNACDAIARGLNYKENYANHSVQWTLENPNNADCTEYSRLLIALCILEGIPARFVNGLLVKPDSLGENFNVGHAWVEVYFDDKGWVSIDPTLHVSMSLAYFGNLLSGQIIFDNSNEAVDSRVNIEFTSSHPDVLAELTNSYFITHW